MKLRELWRARTTAESAKKSPQEKQRVDAAVERIVDNVNPRLRFVSRYQKKLAPAVETAMEYLHGLVATLPAAREANRSAWAGDNTLRALFASADELVRSISRAPDLRTYFEQNPGLAHAYAVVGMAMSERKVLGMAIEGDVLRREVAQTSVSFGDHRVRICGSSEGDLREEIERRLLDQLALEGLARITADESRRDALKQQTALLKTRSRILENEGAGMRAAFGGEPAGHAELARLQTQLAENTRELAELGIGAELLERQLENIRDVLAHPDQHLYVSSRRLRLDGMNVVVENPDATTGVELEFLVARIPGTTPVEERAFVLVRFPRGELLTTGNLREEAARWLI